MKKRIFLVSLLLLLVCSSAVSAGPTSHEVNARSRYHMRGLMTQIGKILYYVDGNAIYKSTLSGKNAEQVYTGHEPANLQTHNGYVYFYDGDPDGPNDSIYRFKPGKAPKKYIAGVDIVRPENYIITNNALYYCEFNGDFYRVDLDTGKARLIEEGSYDHGLTIYSCVNGVIYFTGNDSETSDYKFDIKKDKKLVLANYTHPLYAQGAYFYAYHDEGIQRFKMDQKTGKISDRKIYKIDGLDDLYEFSFFLSDDGIYVNRTKYAETTGFSTELHIMSANTGKSRRIYKAKGDLLSMPTSDYIWIFENRDFTGYYLTDKLAKSLGA